MTSELVLGTAQLGSAYGVNNEIGQLDKDGAFAVLDAAANCGITTLDTAEGYGQSEQLIGSYRQDHPSSNFNVCTKLSCSFDASLSNADDLLNERIRASLQALRSPRFFIYYLHSFAMCRDKRLMELLSEKKQEQLVERVGVSIYEPQELEYILDELIDYVDAVQIPFNVFNCEQWLRDDLIARAADSGIVVLARSIYLQGLVFKEPDDPFVQKLGLSVALERYVAFAEDLGVSRAKLACDYARDTKGISYIILGSETPQQVIENASMFSKDNSWSNSDKSELEHICRGIPPESVDPRKWSR